MTQQKRIERHHVARYLGDWLIRKAKRQQAKLGTQAAARNLRKQGVPFALAYRALLWS